MEFALEGAERRTAHQMVRESLRRAILEGALPGGTRLVQADIATRLNVSTTPVREALRDLATEGLIRLDAHRGAVVHQTNLDEVREIYDLRGLLEPEAARRAATRMSDPEIAELERLQAEMDDEADAVRWIELNRQFHAAIVSAAGSKRLADTLHRLGEGAAVYVGMALRLAPGSFSTGNEQHSALLAAFRARDADRAAQVVRQHLEHTLDVVVDASSGRS